MNLTRTELCLIHSCICRSISPGFSQILLAECTCRHTEYDRRGWWLALSFSGVVWILALVSGARNAGPTKAAADLVKGVPLKSGLGTMAQSQAQCKCQRKGRKDYLPQETWHRSQASPLPEAGVMSFHSLQRFLLSLLPSSSFSTPGSGFDGELGTPAPGLVNRTADLWTY